MHSRSGNYSVGSQGATTPLQPIEGYYYSVVTPGSGEGGGERIQRTQRTKRQTSTTLNPPTTLMPICTTHDRAKQMIRRYIVRASVVRGEEGDLSPLPQTDVLFLST